MRGLPTILWIFVAYHISLKALANLSNNGDRCKILSQLHSVSKQWCTMLQCYFSRDELPSSTEMTENAFHILSLKEALLLFHLLLFIGVKTRLYMAISLFHPPISFPHESFSQPKVVSVLATALRSNGATQSKGATWSGLRLFSSVFLREI